MSAVAITNNQRTKIPMTIGPPKPTYSLFKCKQSGNVSLYNNITYDVSATDADTAAQLVFNFMYSTTKVQDGEKVFLTVKGLGASFYYQLENKQISHIDGSAHALHAAKMDNDMEVVSHAASEQTEADDRKANIEVAMDLLAGAHPDGAASGIMERDVTYDEHLELDEERFDSLRRAAAPRHKHFVIDHYPNYYGDIIWASPHTETMLYHVLSHMVAGRLDGVQTSDPSGPTASTVEIPTTNGPSGGRTNGGGGRTNDGGGRLNGGGGGRPNGGGPDDGADESDGLGNGTDGTDNDSDGTNAQDVEE